MPTTLEDIAAVVVILTGLFGAAYWIGRRTFATREDLHKVNGKISQVGLELMTARRDLEWIKAKLSGEDCPPT